MLVAFHAPAWCIVCRTVVETAFPALATQFSDDAGVSLAELDVSVNEVPPGVPALQQLPTVLLFRANASSLGEAVRYNGDWPQADMAAGGGAAAALAEFVSKERSTPVPTQK